MQNTISRKRALVATRMESELVTNLLKEAGIKDTTTKGRWCLHEGLSHVISVNDQSLRPIVLRSGPPRVYESIKCRHQDAVQSMTNPKSCFESLCRIVAGQQLAGAAAQAVWQRLLETSQQTLTPRTVMELAQQGLTEKLQKPAGLSGAKARSILDLAEKFEAGILSDAFLETAAEHQVREALLKVRGIGPWSCDMFLLFYLERPDVMPLGDLGVRKGIAKHFGLRGTGKHGTLCQKNDLEKMNEAAKPYAPYRSLLSFYMWKVADTKDVYADSKQSAVTAAPRIATPEKYAPTRKRTRK
jgi:DNA-3-methyladenine glycosylase II